MDISHVSISETVENPPSQNLFENLFHNFDSHQDISGHPFHNVLIPLLNLTNIPINPSSPQSRFFLSGHTDIIPIQPPHNLSNAITQSMNEKPKYKHVISPEGLEEIIYKIHKEGMDEKTCAITREVFKDGDEIAILPCTHAFDKEAILVWLKEKSAECPICRMKLNSVEVKEEVSPMRVIPRFRNIRQMIVNMIDDQIQEEEDHNIQQAIIASLRDN